MQINNVNSTNFQAKLVHTKDLIKVVKYAKNDSALLNDLLTMEQNINSVEPNTKLVFELFQTISGLPFVILTRIKSSKGFKEAIKNRDFKEYEPIIVQSKKQIEPLQFGFNILKKIGHKSGYNNFFKRIVLGEKLPIKSNKYEII